MTIKKLIGTDPNQIPLNRDLGSMAYINYKPDNYQAASYGYFTMPGSANTTVYHKVVLDQPLSNNGAILFNYNIAGFLYLVNPNNHYSYFDGVFIAAADASDGVWRIQKIRETAVVDQDYPFTSISAISIISYNGIANAAIQFSLTSTRAGNTPGQSIRFLSSVRRLVSSDGSNLYAGG